MGAGKSTLGRIMSKTGEFHHFSITSALNSLAKFRGGTTWVNDVRRVSPGNVVQTVMPLLVRQLRANPRKGLIIDGIYRPEDLEVLSRRFPRAEIFLIKVKAPLPLRIARASVRDSLSKEEAQSAVSREDRRKIHQGVYRLEKLPHIVVENSSSSEKEFLAASIKQLKRTELLVFLEKYYESRLKTQ